MQFICSHYGATLSTGVPSVDQVIHAHLPSDSDFALHLFNTGNGGETCL